MTRRGVLGAILGLIGLGGLVAVRGPTAKAESSCQIPNLSDGEWINRPPKTEGGHLTREQFRDFMSPQGKAVADRLASESHDWDTEQDYCKTCNISRELFEDFRGGPPTCEEAQAIFKSEEWEHWSAKRRKQGGLSIESLDKAFAEFQKTDRLGPNEFLVEPLVGRY